MRNLRRRIEALERTCVSDSRRNWDLRCERAEEISKRTGQDFGFSFLDACEELKLPLSIAEFDEILRSERN